MHRNNFSLLIHWAARLSVLSILLFTACTSSNDPDLPAKQDTKKEVPLPENPYAEVVVVHEKGNPESLNVINSNDAASTNIKYNIFMYLLDVDKEKLELFPALAKELPTITEITEGEYAGGMKIEYEIRPEAVWDNGTPVTGFDVAFTYKAAKNPLVDAEDLRPYIDFIHDLVIDPNNPKKFTIYSKIKYFGAAFSSGRQAFIAPEYAYDPRQAMRNYTMKDLNDKETLQKIRQDPQMNKFAEAFNGEKHQREKGYIVGCGPYSFEFWKTGESLVLKKKSNWWGESIKDGTPHWENYADKIKYEIIADNNTTTGALKKGKIDVSRGLDYKGFVALKENEDYKDKYHFMSPTELSYVYLGMNMKSPKLRELKVRQAMAHLVDIDRIIKVIVYGMGKPMTGPFHPTKEYYNDEIKPIPYDLERAAQLLDEAGWKDTDNDGVRDKVVDGKKTQLNINYKYNTENSMRETIGIFFKESAEKIGVGVNLLPKEWTVYLEEVKNHQIEIFCLGWVQDPIIDDPKQLWHTESYNQGSNYVGFGNAKTDALIDKIRQELDQDKRNEYYREFQKEIRAQMPYVFIYTPYARLVVSKRLGNVKGYIARPGYIEREWYQVGQANDASN